MGETALRFFRRACKKGMRSLLYSSHKQSFTLERRARSQKISRLAVKQPHGSGQKGNFFPGRSIHRSHRVFSIHPVRS